MKKFLSLALVFATIAHPAGSMVWAEPQVAAAIETTVIRFDRNPNRAIQISRSTIGDQRVTFSVCNAVGGLLPNSPITLSNCVRVYRAEGYTRAELANRYSQLRKMTWLKRLMILPGGAVCGMLLGGALGFVEGMPLMQSSGEIVKAGADAGAQMMKSSVENAGPLGVVVAAPVAGTEVVATTMMGAVVYSIGFGIMVSFAAIGGFFGVPVSWAVVRLATEPSAKQSKVLKPSVQESLAPVVRAKGTLEKYMQLLDGALVPLK